MAVESFETYRSYHIAITSRILGSVMDAKDIVGEQINMYTFQKGKLV